jgi:ActR/RegA family two-component response regulator
MAEGKKILLIDDDSDFRSSTRKILESGGYNVIEAATGEEGFSKAKSESPDLAVIDIIMESFSEGFTPEELGTKYIVQKPVKKDDFLKIVAAAIKTTPTGKKDDLGDAG